MRRRTIAVVLLIGAAAIAASWLGVRAAEHRILTTEAERSALDWAAFLKERLPRLDDILRGASPTEEDARLLAFAVEAGDIVRYRLFGPDGTVVHASRPADVGTTETEPYFVRGVKRGRPYARLVRETLPGGDLRVVGEAYAPIVDEGVFRGAVEVYLDISARALSMHRIATFTLVGLLGLLLAIGAATGYVVRLDYRRRDRIAAETAAARWWAEKAENEAYERAAELAEQTGFLRSVLDNISQGLCVFDRELKLAAWNQGFVNLLDLPEGWVHSERTLFELIRLNAERGDYGAIDAEEIVTRRLGTSRDGTAIRAHHYERVRPDGTVLEVRGNPMPHGGVVTTYTDITARKSAEQTIRKLALSDALTGLANRNQFTRRLEDAAKAARRLDKLVGLVLLDLDKFKHINDSFGHVVGDEILRQTAQRLQGCVRDVDTVARLGGDEFAIILANLAGPGAVNGAVSRMSESLAQPIRVDGYDHNIAASMGISFYPLDDTDTIELLRKADVALYQAKDDGGGRQRLYDAEMDAAAKAQKTLEDDLQRGLKRGEFVLHYQPQIDLADGRTVAVEALIRWHHPERGLVFPDSFVAAAEDNGLIVPLGEWVLRAACAQAKAWQSAGFPPFRMAVNISARQFAGAGFVEVVERTLAETGLAASWLELEITEAMVMDDTDQVIAKLQRLNDLGASLAVDDFGTGYSSLSYLKRFPVHRLKIDRSFVSDVTTDRNDAAIVDAVIALGHSLGLEVVAEGVETAAHAAHLRDRACELAQGYHYCRPLAAEEFEDWMAPPHPARATA